MKVLAGIILALIDAAEGKVVRIACDDLFTVVLTRSAYQAMIVHQVSDFELHRASALTNCVDEAGRCVMMTGLPRQCLPNRCGA